MQIGVPKETAPRERRVALAPDSVARLVKAGATVVVEQGAGNEASFPDSAYASAGATVAPTRAATLEGSDVVARVQRPSPDEARAMKSGAVLISLFQPAASTDVLPVLAERSITALSLERVPRITRAQSMDVLSSQSTVAGYKAVLIGASMMPKFLPMLTTAAGTIAPGKAFVLGAGVAGLQAIATAKRLGAIVSAFDVRPAVREQVQSLGATFVAAEAISTDAEDKGGYAREQSEAQQQRTASLIHDHLKQIDLVVTTAQIPGRPAPKLITEAMVADMRPGSVIVDLAAESGGNCTLTRAGETVNASGVLVYGAVDVPSTVPTHASQMFGRNVLTLLQHLMKDGSVVIDLNDEITGPMCVVHQGQLRS
jgi:H+-translocating NAD(P) transhydrogenase subunit alpha